MTDGPAVGTTTGDELQPGELAPGVTEAGLDNPIRLLEAHQRALLTDGFVVQQTTTVAHDGVEEVRLTQTTTAGPGGEIVRQTARSTGYDADGTEIVTDVDLWLNQTTRVLRHVEAGETTFDVGERVTLPGDMVWSGGLQREVQTAATAYRVTTGPDADTVRLEAALDRVGSDGETDTTVTLAVDDSGVIRSAETVVEYGDGTAYRTTYTVERLGVTAPERPDWVDEVPASAALELGLDLESFDDSTVTLVHTHGDAVPAGSTVTLESGGVVYETTLVEPFRGGTLTLWVDGDGELRVAPEGAGSDATTAFGDELSVTVRAPDGGELFSTSVGR
ncbi:hypothetical protein [Haloarchaeobius amylolyticus]|uniref:hypothetical protein n=1 Tax=Haloarchaeobius amylolyticus TaxID=1198296 RepID=UPI0022700196|nr:hypothetical protein [Haloarchaeobius amylolyticus]